MDVPFRESQRNSRIHLALLFPPPAQSKTDLDEDFVPQLKGFSPLFMTESSITHPLFQVLPSRPPCDDATVEQPLVQVVFDLRRNAVNGT